MKKKNILWLVLASAISGIFYRLGGTGGAWWKNTKVRDIGCALVGMLCMYLFFTSAWYVHLLAFVLLFGALCTYWDKTFGYDNHYAHGLGCAVAYLPYAIESGQYAGFGMRCVLLALAMGIISGLTKNDVIEEVGRGSAIILTLALL